jgi:hypothetical protein
MIVLLCVVESFLETGTPNSNGNRNPTATAIKKPYSNGNQNPTVTAIKHPTATGIQNPILTAIKKPTATAMEHPTVTTMKHPTATAPLEFPKAKQVPNWNSRNGCNPGIPEIDALLGFPKQMHHRNSE